MGGTIIAVDFVDVTRATIDYLDNLVSKLGYSGSKVYYGLGKNEKLEIIFGAFDMERVFNAAVNMVVHFYLSVFSDNPGIEYGVIKEYMEGLEKYQHVLEEINMEESQPVVEHNNMESYQPAAEGVYNEHVEITQPGDFPPMSQLDVEHSQPNVYHSQPDVEHSQPAVEKSPSISKQNYLNIVDDIVHHDEDNGGRSRS